MKQTAELFSKAVIRHFRQLSDALSLLSDSRIKKLLSTAKEHVNSHKNDPKNLDLSIISEPFFFAFHTDPAKFNFVALEYISTLFHASSLELFPDQKITETAIDFIYKTHMSLNHELKIKACKAANYMILSPSGYFYIHDKLLYRLFSSFLVLYNSCAGNQNIQEIIEMSLHELMRTVIGCYDTVLPTPEFENIGQITSYVLSSITTQSLHAITVMPSYPQYANIHDTDVTIAIRALSHIIEKRKFETKTIVLALSTLNAILNSEFQFFSKPFFKDVLNTDISVAILASTYDSTFDTAAYTAALIATSWRRFSNYFADGINEILDSGLTVALSSPDPQTIRRACHVYRILSTSPTIFIDSFVNYDCDHSGHYKNIFENSFDLIIKNCYPTNISKFLQKTALTTATAVLEGLWKFCSDTTTEAQQTKDAARNLIAQKEQKNVFVTGLDLFKSNPKKGLKYFKDHKIVKGDPVSVANFLFDNNQLDPAGVGEIIGGKDNREICKNFVDRFDFKDIPFESAFRTFLKKFIIPGEGQMIDRVMEQFGAKYYAENPTLFSCADTVYVLAYSALMLHTDAHHPTIKKHMTLQEFIKNNNGIDNGRNLPESFLTDLYKGITKEKIFVAPNAVPNVGLLSRHQRAELYKQQCENTLQTARQHITNSNLAFKHCESPLLLGPMLKSVWGRLVAALAISLESSDNPNITQLCLRSMEAAFHIASHCYVEDACQSLLDAFSKFTRLRYEAEQKPKNIECTRTFLRCVREDMDYLKEAWAVFLEAVSDMEKIKEKSNVQSILREAEAIFQLTKNLDREAIVDFTRAQCVVSSIEIEENPPRYYMLQRICDVASWNMDREKIVWDYIWRSIAPHLTLAGTHVNTTTALFAVDCLRQLAQKFLDKPEMIAFHYQERFLQPFLDIFMGQQSQTVHELIIDIICRIVQNVHTNLSSGWSVILQLLSEASKTSLYERAFQILENVLVNYPEDFSPYTSDVLLCLGEFSLCKDINISFRALPFFTVICGMIQNNDSWPIAYQQLTRVCKHPAPEIQTLASESVLEITLKYGCALKIYDNELWTKILSEYLPNMILSCESQMQTTLIDEIFQQIFAYEGALYPNNVTLFVLSLYKAEQKTKDSLLDLFKNYLSSKEIESYKSDINTLIQEYSSKYPESSNYFEHISRIV